MHYLYLLGFVIALSACDTKNCTEVICGNNQICKQGTCFCKDGYEGNTCEDIAAEKYVGNYNISKTCTHGQGALATFGTVFTDGNPLNELMFTNFLGLGNTAYAFIGTDQNGKGNYLRFPQQNLGGSATQISGEGYYIETGAGKRFSIDIQLVYNGQSSLCTYTYY